MRQTKKKRKKNVIIFIFQWNFNLVVSCDWNDKICTHNRSTACDKTEKGRNTFITMNCKRMPVCVCVCDYWSGRDNENNTTSAPNEKHPFTYWHEYWAQAMSAQRKEKKYTNSGTQHMRMWYTQNHCNVKSIQGTEQPLLPSFVCQTQNKPTILIYLFMNNQNQKICHILFDWLMPSAMIPNQISYGM